MLPGRRSVEFQTPLGVVVKASIGQITVECPEPTIANEVEPGSLCAIEHAASDSWIITIVDQVQCSYSSNGDDSPLRSTAGRTQAAMTVVGQCVREGESGWRLKRGAQVSSRLGANCFRLESDNLRHLLESINSALDASEKLEIGRFTLAESIPAALSGDRFFQRHAAILGSTGAGKSWAVATLLERASDLKSPNIVLFDLHGEYQPLGDMNSGFCQSLKIAGPTESGDPQDGVIFLPYWMLSRDEFLTVVAQVKEGSAQNHASRFSQHILDLKLEWCNANQPELGERSVTTDSPIPFSLDELIGRLEAENTERVPGAKEGTEKDGPWTGKLTTVLARLYSRVADRRNRFLFDPPVESMSPNWLAGFANQLLCAGGPCRGIKIVDFSEVPSDLLPTAASLLARFLYQTQIWIDAKSRHPLCLVCDEAHLYLPRHDEANINQLRALETFERIAKEGRKYGVSLLVVSQRPSDISTTILSQCNNIMVLRLTNPQDQAIVRRLLPDNLSDVSQVLPLLETGETIVIGDAISVPLRIKLDTPSSNCRPISTTRNFWNDWKTGGITSDAIVQAVANMRKQSK
jgi:hypothetical protein